MKINVFGENITVTSAIEDYINDKFSHLYKPEKLTQADFRIGSTKTDKYVHFYAHTPKEDLVIKTSDKDLYHAFDSIMHKIHLAFTKEKQKNNSKSPNPNKII